MGGWGRESSRRSCSGFDTVAESGGFIVVYPDGVRRSWADGRGTTPADKQGVDDVGFLTALVDHFIEKFGADRRRVYATGMSNGAMMSYRLACERADRFAAIAPVAAQMGQKLAERCTPSRPVSVISFVGTEDPLVPFAGGEVSGDRGPVLVRHGDPEQVGHVQWVRGRSPLSRRRRIRSPEDGTRVRREAHGPCREGSEVVFYVVEGGGHGWPGGSRYLRERLVGRTSQDIDASQHRVGVLPALHASVKRATGRRSSAS